MPTVPLKLGCWMKSVIVTWSPMWRARPCLSVLGSDADSVGGVAVAEDEGASPGPDADEGEDDGAAACLAADSTGGREERAAGDRLRGLSLTLGRACSGCTSLPEAEGCAVAEEEDAAPGREVENIGGGGRNRGR